MALKAQYKLINPKFHCGMGNVPAVKTDRKFIKDKSLFMAELVTASDSVQCHFEAYQNKVQNLHWRMPISKSLKFGKSELLRIRNRYYYAFGAPLYGRKYVSQAGSYRFGFNGKEKDDELKGEGNSLDFGARIYDSRLGRFLSLDPDAIEYPYMSPYCFAANNPIRLVDIEGKGPGDPFKSADEAAINWAQTYNDNSISENKEFASVIYEKTDEKGVKSFYYTAPNVGTLDHVTPNADGIKDADIYAEIHSHGAYNVDYDNRDGKYKGYDKINNNNEFSTDDENAVKNSKRKKTYLATPSGELKKWDPQNPCKDSENCKDEIESISKEIPSDTKTDDRVNKIDYKEGPKDEPINKRKD